ncbi:acyl-CoA dehydrogenase family protein [Streptomyces sp. NPDC048172]|uniref:acyl-CoA dehydrogenase family protein n=1 Tax=Streptomyces sp. NPDC048172 TaxID=3365505 RepID=UPI0037128268
MDFTPTEEQEAVRGLAARICADLSTPDRLAVLRADADTDADGTETDRALWKTLCAAGLPEAVEETGLLGLALVLEEQGRTTAQVPLAASCAYGVLTVAAHGTDEQRARLLPPLRDGSAVVAGALPLPGDPGDGAAVSTSEWGEETRLSGTVPVVPWLRDATHVLVADGTDRCHLVETVRPEVTVTPVETTAPWSCGRLDLDGAPGEPLREGAYGPTFARARTAFAALQVGVCAGSVARAVEHTTRREQFGRPLATRQAVQLRAADAHMDTEAIRVTVHEAAWRHDQGLPFRTHALTAAWWASEAGRRVVHAGQHLHGGVGADVGHPVHRHFLWGRQLDAHLGAPGRLLAELGDLLADPGNDTEWREDV